MEPPTNRYNCPICAVNLEPVPRYPNYVCENCCDKACDKNGRKVVFGNTSFSGGFEGGYVDTNEEYKSHTCYINGIKCYANEAHFGGIVIEKKGN